MYSSVQLQSHLTSFLLTSCWLILGENIHLKIYIYLPVAQLLGCLRVPLECVGLIRSPAFCWLRPCESAVVMSQGLKLDCSGGRPGLRCCIPASALAWSCLLWVFGEWTHAWECSSSLPSLPLLTLALKNNFCLFENPTLMQVHKEALLISISLSAVLYESLYYFFNQEYEFIQNSPAFF